MTPEELARARKLIAKIATERPKRRSRRLRPAPRGERLDLRRMVRASLATGGDPLERPYRARVERHRKLVAHLRRLGLDGDVLARARCSSSTRRTAPAAASRRSPSARG